MQKVLLTLQQGPGESEIGAPTTPGAGLGGGGRREGRHEGGLAPCLVDTEGEARVTQRQGWNWGWPPGPATRWAACAPVLGGDPPRVGEDSRADVPASPHPAPTRCKVPWAQRGSVTGQAFPPVLRAFWAAWPALQADSRLPAYSPTLALQGQRVCFLWVQHILATTLSHQTPCGFSQA